MATREVAIAVPGTATRCSALVDRPTGARALLVLAHGAGAGMRHPFMEQMAERLSARGIATLRYQFPYWQEGKRRPDPQPLLLETVRSAVTAARSEVPGLPLFAGGKSMGGRMTTLAASEEPLAGLEGIVLLGFPLHPPGPPSRKRAAHLESVPVPMLFLQGTRDTLADIEHMREVCADLGERATLHVLEGGDHSFHVLKRSGRNDDEMMDEAADAIGRWIDARLG